MPDISVVIAVIGLLAVAAVGRLLEKTWIAPGAFFALCWAMFTVFTVSGPLVGVEKYDVWHGSIWWIVLTISFIIAGSVSGRIVGGWHPVSGARDLKESDFPRAVPLMAVCAASGIAWPILVPQLVAWGDHPPMYLQVLLGLHYTGPLFGGIAYACATSRRFRWLALSTLIPGIVFGVLDTGRTKIASQFEFWFAGYFAAQIYLRARPFRLFSVSRVLAGIATGLLFVAAGVLFTPWRGVPRDTPLEEKLTLYWEMTDRKQLAESWEWMHSSIFGQLAGFSWYFEHALANPPRPKFPENTFAGIYRAFGGELGEPIYTDIGGISTNIFTIFKPPIEDYTLPGSLVVAFLFGFASGWAYGKVRSGTMWPMVIVMHSYVEAMGIGGWFFTYNSVTGAFVVLGIYLKYVQRLKTDRKADRLWRPSRLAVQEASPRLRLTAAPQLSRHTSEPRVFRL